MNYRRIPFVNTQADAISLENAVEVVFVAIERRNKLHIVFLNALKIHEIEKDSRMAEAVSAAELILADGVPIVWASRLFGRPLPGRVNGTDLFELLLARSEREGKRIFLLGATEKHLDDLMRVLRQSYPKLNIAGYRNGYFSDSDDVAVIEQINLSGADILFLGFSSPKKELWAYKHKHEILAPVIQGVGGSFDVVAGIIPRAPRWMQKYGLEWLDRVIREPRRMLKRYMISNTNFVYLTLRALFREKVLRQS
ncbi:MAG: WecB/TagA/CpsF family glycosyltransferase [Ignavibacteriae bacterium]|nr:WecB/TagA/CpsF family glycosyltransferase [Ignavibacteriota bacterium]